jgi:hypothetical protein
MGGQYKIDLKEISIHMRNWAGLVQDRDHWRTFKNTPLNLRVP